MATKKSTISHAHSADLADRARMADIADAAMRLVTSGNIRQRSGDKIITRESGEAVQVNGSVAALKNWFHDLLSPQTLVWLMVFVAGFIASWFTMGQRIAVQETSSASSVQILQKQIDEIKNDVTKLENKQRDDLRDAVTDRNQRIKDIKTESDEADARLWQDINQLRQALIAHISDNIHVPRK